MRIKLCEGTRLAGPMGNWGPGDVVDVIEAAGMAMIARGQAVAVDAPRVAPETAAMAKSHTATLPKPRRRKSTEER